MTTHAVLTGDLVKSAELTDASLYDARSSLLAAAKEMAGWQENLLGSEPDFFRGDSWQILLMKPQLCLRSAIFLRARLRAENIHWDTRIAIGLGTVAHIDASRTSLSTGEAFTLSGHALDAFGTTSNIVVATPPKLKAWDALAPLARLCSVLVDGWSQSQAMVASLALAPQAPTQSEIARRLKITQQAVSKALMAAKMSPLLETIAYCERWS